MVEANHFYSQTETHTALNIGDATKEKPLVFLLQPNNNADSKENTEFNPVTVAIATENENKTCTINSFFGLCELPKLTGDKPTLSIDCKTAPCEVRWEIIQP